ncbi:NAD(P)-binding domain-containing protein [Hoeflea sp. CAU 1731]
MSFRSDVVIIGAGQAGLATSRCLTSLGIDHVLIERGRVGERWRSERWDSLRLLTPNWMTRLPGHLYSGDDPKGFMHCRDVVRLLEDYRQAFAAPVMSNTRVTRLCTSTGGYRIATDRGEWFARTVVIATGACDKPFIPAIANGLADRILHLAPSDYKNADNLPKGGVLVIGASASGIQIAEEIRRSGRNVAISTGRHVSVPRSYRGRDITEWLDLCGFLSDERRLDADPQQLARQPSLQLIGSDNRRSIGLAELSRQGIRILGRAVNAEDRHMQFAADLDTECKAARERRHRLLARIDAHIDDNAIEAPEDPAARECGYVPDNPAGWLDLRAEGIETIIWATGFRRDYSWMQVPVLGRHGEIENASGATAAPGLFVLGLPFMRRRASTFIDGVGRDAEYLAPLIAKQLNHPAGSLAA